ncbi:hypothetical protein DFH28DRAFT_909481, partial [Melampsora americana]
TILDDEVKSKRTALDLDRPSLSSITSSQDNCQTQSLSAFRLIKHQISKLKWFYKSSSSNQKQKRKMVNLVVLSSDQKSRRSYNTISSLNESDEESSGTLKRRSGGSGLRGLEGRVKSIEDEIKTEANRQVLALRHLERSRERLKDRYQVEIKAHWIHSPQPDCQIKLQETIDQTHQLREHRWSSFLKEKESELDELRIRKLKLWDIPESIP